MPHSVTRAKETHQLELVQTRRDDFGITWHVFHCPTCGRRTQVSTKKVIVLNPGTDAMTGQTGELVIQMHREGRHREASELVASYPGHKYEARGFSADVS